MYITIYNRKEEQAHHKQEASCVLDYPKNLQRIIVLEDHAKEVFGRNTLPKHMKIIASYWYCKRDENQRCVS